MQCTSCQHECATGAKFCESCGAPLAPPPCAGCGAVLSASARFCGQCGRAVAAPTSPPSEQLQAAKPAAEVGERRQIAAMFCDLRGWTELSATLDEEDLRDLITSYQGTCDAAVKRFDGLVAQFLGDGVLAYFGYPNAHEDDAERAVRAALEIQTQLAEGNEERRAQGAPEIVARVGIHIGPVVLSTLGSAAHQETLALGQTINVAARIQSLAPPGGIVVSDAVVRLVADRFATRDLGEHELKGLTEAVRVHAVDRAAPRSASRDRERAGRPFIGRQRDLERLLDLWSEAAEGRGQVALISADAGLGKSRLLGELSERVPARATIWAQCVPHSGGVAFQPLIEAWERSLGIAESDAPAARLAKLEAFIDPASGLDAAELVPYLAALFGLPPSAKYPLPTLSPELLRERTLHALIAPALARAAREPLLIAIEDLHWADPSTLELLGRLIDQAPTLRLFVAVTHRPSFEPPWARRSWIHPVVLSRMDDAATRAITAAAAGNVQLPESVARAIAERADGVPLFAEELTRSVIESGALLEVDGRFELVRGRVAELAVPDSLHGSLMARLDGLRGAKPVAQLGATIGREFPQALIEACTDLDRDALRRGLDRLVDAEILFRRGVPPDAIYTFKHALLQDTAYESQLRSRRRELHARIADAIEQEFPARAAAEPLRLARHCAEGGLTQRAIAHYARAGAQAGARVALIEAIEAMTTALTLLETLPAGAERDQQEVSLRLALSGPLTAYGYQRPETLANAERIAVLADRVTSDSARVPALVGLATFNIDRSHPEMRRWAERLLAVLGPEGDPALRLTGHWLIASACLSSGTVPEALEHTRQALALSRRELASGAGVLPLDLDAQALMTSVHGLALLLAGFPEQSRAALKEAVQRAHEHGGAFTRLYAASTSSVFYSFLGDLDQAFSLANESLDIAALHGFSARMPDALVVRGGVRVRRGDPGGLEDVERGVAISLESGRWGGIVNQHVAAAAAYLFVGQFERMETLLQGAAAMMEKTGERAAYEPQISLMRAAGIVGSGRGALDEAERLLLASLEGWAHFASPWMELQCLLQYAEVAFKTGNVAPVRERLAKCYAGFSEGFQTPQLRAAQRVLQALGG